MECNKDEAFRAKEIAERKVTEKDYAGARKAQNLYPGLDGIAQCARYESMGADEAVRKQYRELALMLHPDKNKLVGADGPFKLVSEAWSLSSYQAKRLAYNQRINFRGTQQKFRTQSGVSSMPPRANGSRGSSSK